MAKETPEIIYKEVRELLVQPKGIKLMDEDNKLTICAFVDKFVSKIYGIRKINTWLSKKKGCTFFDCLITISDIAYTVAILENSQLHMQLPAKNIVLAHKPIEGSSFQNCLSGKIVRLVQEFDHVLVIVRVDGHDLKVIVSKRAQRQLELSEQQLVYCHHRKTPASQPMPQPKYNYE